MGTRYVVLLRFKGAAPVERIKSVLNNLKDWLRFSADAWIVYTDIAPGELRDRLKNEFAAEDPSMVIIEANASHWAAYASSTIREWLRNTPSEVGE